MDYILQRALIRHCNEFFTMSPEEQDIFKLEDHDELDKKIVKFVSDAMNYGEDEDDPIKQFEYNKIMLEYRGIGENHFMLNEYDWNKDILKHKTVYDYNVYYHEWQEEAMSSDENFPEFERTELYNRFAAWARAEINNKFHYLNVSSLQMWIHWQLEEFGFDWIDKAIPHEYVPGPENGKKTEDGTVWDFHVDAKGLEGWYEQIKDFSYKWLNNRFKEVTYLNDVVYMLDTTNDEIDPSMDIVFGSMDILKKITFKNFIKDSENVSGDNSELLKLKNDSLKEFEQALENALVEIKKTSPNVIKLKKKMKVVMTDKAVDGMNNLSE